MLEFFAIFVGLAICNIAAVFSASAWILGLIIESTTSSQKFSMVQKTESLKN
jgi:hypothetical protein